MLMFKSFALRIFEWVLRPVDTYLYKVNNKHRTILMDVFPFILCRIFKILVGIGKMDNNLCWLIQIQDLLKKRKLLLFLSLFFFTFSFLVFLITIKTFINIFMEIRNNKQPPEVLYEKSAIRNFAKFTGKHPYQSLFFNKVAGLRPATLVKKRLRRRCFPVNFAKFISTPILKNICKQLLLKQEIIFVWVFQKSRKEVFSVLKS